MSQLLERILREIQSLSPEERDELVAMLRGPNGTAESSDAESVFEDRLASEGFLTMPSPPESHVPLGAPLRTHGLPLSRVVVQERR